MDLSKFLESKGFAEFEGNISAVPREVNFLSKIVSDKNIKNVLEIGFNAGHSAEIFLSRNPNCKLVSFELGKHNYTRIAKNFIDRKYPNRHTLIIGDSNETIPKYNPNFKFDLIFIDGGHEYNIALNDINNCKRLSHKNTVIIIDDVVINKNMQKKWNSGPTEAWMYAFKNKIIKPFSTITFKPGRGIGWGKYLI